MHYFFKGGFPVKESRPPSEGFCTQPAVDIVQMFFREMTALPLYVVAAPLAHTTWRIFMVMVNVFF
tara:strand:+ start:341 stop:538 length:198 start_codon:yes stop_codon:yes gene_type:complete